jgi:hypothetical protein
MNKMCPILNVGFLASAKGIWGHLEQGNYMLSTKDTMRQDNVIICIEDRCMAYKNGDCRFFTKETSPFVKSSDIIKGE